MRWKIFLLAVVLGASMASAQESEMQILPDDAIFAVVTHKGGMAAGLAHNHLVVAESYEAHLASPADAPEKTVFSIELRTADLTVDDPLKVGAWYPLLEFAGILDEKGKELDEKERGKIREAMLSKKQLNVEAHPAIRARLEGLEPFDGKAGELVTAWRATLAFEVVGRTVEKPVLANLDRLEDGTLHVQAVGTFLFSDFGIKPYSAMMGAVKNLDEFHVYVNFKAK